jgi:hypothetical protein
MRKLLIPLCVVALLAGARSASAASILVNGNTAFVVDWLLTTPDPDYSGTATFTVSNYTTSSFRLTISDIKNTMALSPVVNLQMTLFGFGLTPDATGVSVVQNGTDFHFSQTGSFPDFNTDEICATANNCASGGSGGLSQGQSSADVLIIDISGNFTSGVTFSPIPVRFQGSPGTENFDATSITTIPEPSGLLLLGSGLALAVRQLRRRNRTDAAVP